MTNITPEMISKAKATRSAEELAALAKESGMEMTEEEANAYFAQLHPVSGELSDEELDNVAGGGCYKGDRLVVTAVSYCTDGKCKKCQTPFFYFGRPGHCHCYLDHFTVYYCETCYYCSYEEGLWLCNHPDKRK